VSRSFSPSANNNARFYLVTDNENIVGAVDGYFLQFGEAGSNDAIELFSISTFVLALTTFSSPVLLIP
jgi:hypothetical protein